jgi:hypothetical protein
MTKKSTHANLQDAMTELVDMVSNLQNLVSYDNKSSLLDAAFEFAYIEEQLTNVRLLVEKQRKKLEND